MVKIILIIGNIFLALNCFAQLPAIDTDRPDQTESVNNVPKKYAQFEFGFNAQQNSGHNYEYLTPTLLSKYGISNKIEIRVITSILTTSQLKIPNGTFSTTGLDPVALGAKISLWQGKKILPKTTFLFHFAIPGIASKTNNIDLIAPNFKLLFQNSITENFGIGYNLGAEWNGEDAEPAYVYTVSPGVNFSKKWYGYVEAFGFIKSHELPQHNIDGGLAYNFSNNCRMDISSGFGISKSAPRWYVSLGFSFRVKVGK